MDALETIELDHGFKVEIHQDDDGGANDPRDWDNLGTMLCWHRRADLGDETVRTEDFESLEDLARHHEFVIWQPLWLYEHSGMTIRTTNDVAVNPFVGRLPQGHAEFDSGMVGIIGITAEKLTEEFPGDFGPSGEERVREIFEGEVETYDQWLSGDVYGYVVKSPDGEVLDSCWGFFGFECVKTEGKAAAEHYVTEENEAEAEIALARY